MLFSFFQNQRAYLLVKRKLNSFVNEYTHLFVYIYKRAYLDNAKYKTKFINRKNTKTNKWKLNFHPRLKK
jgi:hypothetical protein